MDTNALRLCLSCAICFALAACSAAPVTPNASESQGPELPEPGRKLLMAPDRVWEIENCEARPLPHLRLERSEVVPATISPGNSIIYGFPYIACVPAQPGYILGRLRTTVSFGLKELNTRIDDKFPVETGQWTVDTEITVPSDAAPGLYTLEGTLSAKGMTIKDRLHFTVQTVSP